MAERVAGAQRRRGGQEGPRGCCEHTPALGGTVLSVQAKLMCDGCVRDTGPTCCHCGRDNNSMFYCGTFF